MTIAECKTRAKQEFKFYLEKEGMESAVRNGLTSMASDLRKTGTSSEGMVGLCIMQMQFIHNEQQFNKFIDGFN